jgi:hypothetical protein
MGQAVEDGPSKLVSADTGTETTLNEAQVHAFVANNGFGYATDVPANTTALTVREARIADQEPCPPLVSLLGWCDGGRHRDESAVCSESKAFYAG